MDFIDIGPECFASGDETIISYKGHNFYMACGFVVATDEQGRTSSCVKRMNHPGVIHEDWDGNCKDEGPHSCEKCCKGWHASCTDANCTCRGLGNYDHASIEKPRTIPVTYDGRRDAVVGFLTLNPNVIDEMLIDITGISWLTRTILDKQEILSASLFPKKDG